MINTILINFLYFSCVRFSSFVEILGSNTFPARSFPPDGTTFAQVTLGDKISNVIPPYSYWNMQFYHSEAAYVRFELGLPRSASLGLYGRRNALPTHTHYDMLHIISGYKSRSRRASTVIGCHKKTCWFSNHFCLFHI